MVPKCLLYSGMRLQVQHTKIDCLQKAPYLWDTQANGARWYRASRVRLVYLRSGTHRRRGVSQAIPKTTAHGEMCSLFNVNGIYGDVAHCEAARQEAVLVKACLSDQCKSAFLCDWESLFYAQSVFFLPETLNT